MIEKSELTKGLSALTEQGYSIEQIIDAAKYIAEKDRLLALAIMHSDDDGSIFGGFDYITTTETLPIEFIEEYSKYLDWKLISMYQAMPEEFIQKHENDVDWFYIFKCQDHLSGNFIKKNINKIRSSIDDKMYYDKL